MLESALSVTSRSAGKVGASQGGTPSGAGSPGSDYTPGLFDGEPMTKAATPYVEPETPAQERPSEAVSVLTLGEAAGRLGAWTALGSLHRRAWSHGADRRRQFMSRPFDHSLTSGDPALLFPP